MINNKFPDVFFSGKCFLMYLIDTYGEKQIINVYFDGRMDQYHGNNEGIHH